MDEATAVTQSPISAPAHEHAPEYVQSRRMSYEEFLHWDPEGGLTEWVNGEAFQYMSATAEHQMLVDFLNRLIGLFVQLFKLGRVFTGPYTMRARPDGSGREPDIFVVLTENLRRVRSEQLEGPADLVIEVVSDDSVTRDRVTKYDEYEVAGVREYWLIDPRPNRRRASFFVLDEKGVYQPAPVSADGIYRSTVLKGFWLRTQWLWLEDPPVLEILSEVAGSSVIPPGLKI
jgi:Uma2 family endonuclease